MNKNTESKILQLLADHLGVEKDDISLDDSFRGGLSMSSIDLADFAHKLQTEGFEVNPEEIALFKTPGDLVEYLGEEDI